MTKRPQDTSEWREVYAKVCAVCAGEIPNWHSRLGVEEKLMQISLVPLTTGGALLSCNAPAVFCTMLNCDRDPDPIFDHLLWAYDLVQTGFSINAHDALRGKFGDEEDGA